MPGRPKQPKPESCPYPPGWEPFLVAIGENLDDDTPRLVFADWLQENGDEARAEFIRIQCDHARGRPADAARADSLLAANRRKWLRGLPKSLADNPKRCTFRRGFPAAITVQGFQFVSNGEAICRLTPIEELTLAAVTPEALKVPAIAGIRKLTLGGVNSAKVEALAGSPALPGLVDLSITWGDASRQSMRKLLANPALTRLRRLSLQSIPVGNAVAAALAAPHTTGLEELRLRHTRLDYAGAVALAHAPASLRVLDLHNNHIEDTGLFRLLASPVLQNLEELGLGSCRLGPASARALANWPGLRTMRRLDLRNNLLGKADVEQIRTSPHATCLEEVLAT